MKLNNKLGIKGVYTIELHDAKTGKLKERKVVENLVPNVMLNAVASQIANDQTFELQATYIALGDDNTAPAAGDTQLTNETVRKALALDSSSANVATLKAFFGTSEGNDTHREIGLFGEGAATQATAVSNSGLLMSHALETIIKTVSDTLTISIQMTIS